MKRILIISLIGMTFTLNTVIASAETLEVGSATPVSYASAVTNTADEDLLVCLLQDADLEGIKSYMALFEKYSGETIADLTVEEILDYINMYGDYTGKDLVTELNLTEVVANIESFKDIKDFENIIYLAENYESDVTQDTEDEVISEDESNIEDIEDEVISEDESNIEDIEDEVISEVESNNQDIKDEAISKKDSNNKNTKDKSIHEKDSYIQDMNNKGKNENYNRDINNSNKKINVDNYSFEQESIQKFTGFFETIFKAYLNGNISLTEVVDSIVESNIIPDNVSTNLNKNDNSKQKLSGNNTNVIAEDYVQKQTQEDDTEPVTAKTSNTSNTAKTSNTSNTGDVSVLPLAVSFVLGVLGINRKRGR